MKNSMDWQKAQLSHRDRATRSVIWNLVNCCTTLRTRSSATAELGTARRAMLVNSCTVLRGMGVRKVSNSKRDLQGYSRAMVPFDRPHTISYWCSIATIIIIIISTFVVRLLQLEQWRKSRGGRGGHVPLKNWTAGDSDALCPPKFGF